MVINGNTAQFSPRICAVLFCLGFLFFIKKNDVSLQRKIQLKKHEKNIITIIILLVNNLISTAQIAADSSSLYMRTSDNIDLEISIYMERDSSFKDSIVMQKIFQVKIWNNNDESIYIPNRKSYSVDTYIRGEYNCLTNFAATNEYILWTKLLYGDSTVYKFAFSDGAISPTSNATAKCPTWYRFVLQYVRKELYDAMLKERAINEDDYGNKYIQGERCCSWFKSHLPEFGYIVVSNSKKNKALAPMM